MDTEITYRGTKGQYDVYQYGRHAGTVARRDNGMWVAYGVPGGTPSTGATRKAAVEIMLNTWPYPVADAPANKPVHRYGDPCATCGQPAYDYNVPTCHTCKDSEQANGTDPLSRLYTPGKARVLAAIRNTGPRASVASPMPPKGAPAPLPVSQAAVRLATAVVATLAGKVGGKRATTPHWAAMDVRTGDRTGR